MVKDLAVAVVADGTPDFSQEEGPGKDMGPNNGVVRSLDTVDYEVSWQVTKDGDYTLEAELPAGVEFAAGSDSFCNNAGKAISNDLTYKNKNTLRCELSGKAGQSVKSAVKVFVRRAANDSVIPLQFTAGGATSNKIATTVSAKAEGYGLAISGGDIWTAFEEGDNKYLYGSLYFNVTANRPATGIQKGLEALTGDYTINMPLDLPEGSFVDCNGEIGAVRPEGRLGNENNSYRNNGKCEVSYDKAAKVLNVNISGADLTASSWPTRTRVDSPWNENYLNGTYIRIALPAQWTTENNDPSGTKKLDYGDATLSATSMSEEPVTATASVSQGTVVNAGLANVWMDFPRNDGESSPYTGGATMMPGQTRGMSWGSGFNRPGEFYGGTYGQCVSVNPDELRFVPGSVRNWVHQNRGPNGTPEFYVGDEDTLADSFDCGFPGDGNSQWVTNPSDYSKVRAVRIKHMDIIKHYHGDSAITYFQLQRPEESVIADGAKLYVQSRNYVKKTDGIVVNINNNPKFHASYGAKAYFVAQSGSYRLEASWGSAQAVFGDTNTLTVKANAKNLTDGTITVSLPEGVKVTDPAGGTISEDGRSVSWDAAGFTDPKALQVQVTTKSPATIEASVVLTSEQFKDVIIERRTAKASFVTGMAEHVTAAISTSAPDNVVTLETGTVSIPLTLSWGNATTGDASGELVWSVPGNAVLASVGEAPSGVSVQCTAQDRTEVTAGLAADKSGKTLTWSTCPADTAGLAGVTAVKVVTGTLASTATGTLPVSVTANAVGDVNTSFTAGVFTTAGNGTVDFLDATPINVYVRTPAPEPVVTEGEWTDATDSSAKNCDTKQVTQTRTVTTTPFKWDAAGKQWVADPDHATTRTETQTRDMSDEELQVCTPKPADDVKTAEWVDSTDAGAKNCATKQVSQTRTKTTTPYKWDTATKTWVLDTDKVKVESETQTRPMNDTELMACAIRPADKVDTTEWVDSTEDGAKDCATGKVKQTRTKTTTPYKWDTAAHEYVVDTENAVTITETQNRDMTDSELQVCSPKPADKIDNAEWVDSTDEGAKDCATGKVIQSRTVTTTPYKWDAGTKKWVLDTEKAVTTTETQKRDMTDSEFQVCTPAPADDVKTTEWVDSSEEGAKDCVAGKVKQSRTVTTTPYKWDATTKTWVVDTDKAVTTTETQTRDMSDGELQECTVNPGIQVEETQWVDSSEDGAKDCATKKVTQTRTVTTTPYKWDSAAKKWVLDSENATSKIETQTRDMNEDETRVCMAGTGVPVYPDPTPVAPGGKIVIDPVNGPDNPAQCEPSGPITRADGGTVTVDKDCKVTITIPEGKTPGELTPPVEVTPKYPTPDKPTVVVPVKVIDTPDWDDTTTTPDSPVTIEKRKGEIPEGATVEVTGPGTAVLNPDGSITLTPDNGAQPGTTITIKVVDKVGNPLDNITVTIIEPKPAPDWDDSITGPGKKIDVPNKGGDVPPGTTITVNGPGSAVLNPDGSITVTPNEGARPGEKITIAVSDGEGKVVDSFTVKIGKLKTAAKSLPVTGASATGLAGMAVLLVVAGGLVAWQRRRK
ncbi:Ig-like domain-containing protein [Actinotignum sp. GS-2025g]|uniref:Ig-like domain-containing protein n=1 Tax=Actinotignum sp. GS-2025g TaxID=3427280 RepID=UPI003F46861B